MKKFVLLHSGYEEPTQEVMDTNDALVRPLSR